MKNTPECLFIWSTTVVYFYWHFIYLENIYYFVNKDIAD